MTNTETIQSLYAAFGRGDVQTILGHLADNVDWDNTRVASKECPWNGNFSGKANVPGFFKAVGDNLEMSVFEPRTFVDSANHVAVELRIEGQIKKNGQAFKSDAVHMWTFDNQGRVTAYRQFNDTAMELAAWRA